MNEKVYPIRRVPKVDWIKDLKVLYRLS
jgi:hypothetical protein